MKIFLKSFLILLCSTSFFTAFAWEPPDEVSTKEKVRMSTLIVVGTVQFVEITDRNFTTTRPDHVGLKNDEIIHLHIKVDRVLYPKGVVCPSAEVMLRANHLDVREIRKGYVGKSARIFYLTNQNDGSAADFFCYPFYQYTNLCDPISKENEVIRLITAFDAIN